MKVSYSKEMRLEAKSKELGLVTIDFVTVKGGRVTTQSIASEEMLKLTSDFVSKMLQLENELIKARLIQGILGGVK